MRNPLKDEETAFRVVLGTIAYLALIVLASWLATWLGVVVFIVLTVIAVWILRGGKRTSRPRSTMSNERMSTTR